ncbi:hypothetical protein HYU92_00525 [Candidatus Curtissbacteria bacterium]|nr:hypothetical protein [Candidatus Curtissbacteria bacterium]
MERLGPSLKKTGKEVLRQVIGYEEMPLSIVICKAMADGTILGGGIATNRLIDQGRTDVAFFLIILVAIATLGDRLLMSGYQPPKKDQ